MSKYSVLICDDNPAIYISLSSYFEDDGIGVLTAGDGQSALSIMSKGGIDLIILDVMLPDMSGLDICKEIRKTSDIPILMLSAKSDEFDRILGLEIGADDYVTKPFSPHEVYVRVKKLLKRLEVKPVSKKYECAELVILPDSYEVYASGKKIPVTAKEIACLEYFILHQNLVVTREHIINAIWGVEYIGEPRIVDTLITRLRKKLFADQEKELHFDISTVFGVGYKLEIKQ